METATAAETTTSTDTTATKETTIATKMTTPPAEAPAEEALGDLFKKYKPVRKSGKKPGQAEWTMKNIPKHIVRLMATLNNLGSPLEKVPTLIVLFPGGHENHTNALLPEPFGSHQGCHLRTSPHARYCVACRRAAGHGAGVEVEQQSFSAEGRGSPLPQRHRRHRWS